MSTVETNNDQNKLSFTNKLLQKVSPEKRDKLIDSATKRLPKWCQPEVLRLAGSKENRESYLKELFLKQADSFEPLFKTQIERGALTPEKAAELRKTLIDGDVNLLLLDSIIGMIVCGGIEKPLVPLVGAATAAAGYPEWSYVIAGAFMSANTTAVPYFAYRAVQEFNHHKNRLQEQQVPIHEQSKLLSRTITEGTLATFMNTWPFPLSLIAIGSAPLLTKQRYSELFSVYLKHQTTNIKEKLKKTVIVL